MRIKKITINYKNGKDQLVVASEPDDGILERQWRHGCFYICGRNFEKYINVDLIGNVNVEYF